MENGKAAVKEEKGKFQFRSTHYEPEGPFVCVVIGSFSLPVQQQRHLAHSEIHFPSP